MTEPKRWTIYVCPNCGRQEPVLCRCEEPIDLGGGATTPQWHRTEPVEVVAAADFDRLRDELDSLSTLYVAARDSEGEVARVAGVLADALRDSLDGHDGQGECPCEECEQGYAALAVFDTLTEEKPDA